MKKKLLAIFLAAAMAVSLLSLTAWADDDTASGPPEGYTLYTDEHTFYYDFKDVNEGGLMPATVVFSAVKTLKETVVIDYYDSYEVTLILVKDGSSVTNWLGANVLFALEGVRAFYQGNNEFTSGDGKPTVYWNSSDMTAEQFFDGGFGGDSFGAIFVPWLSNDDGRYIIMLESAYDGTVPSAPAESETPTEPETPAGPQVVDSGSCGEAVTWTLTDDGVLTVSGTGAMGNYGMEPAPWQDYADSIKSVVIGDGVTTIGDFAFYGYSNLASVSIPDSVTAICLAAFEDCASLVSVAIPDSVTEIGNDAFAGTGLTSVIIPGSITYITSGAFEGCPDLTAVKIGDGVKAIYGTAFGHNPSLTGVVIPASVTETDGLFEGSENVTIYGYGGSLAQSLAIDYQFPFVDLDIVEAPTVDGETSVTTYDQGSGEGVKLHCSAPLSEFVGLVVDGKVVSPAYYTLEEGSTIVNLNAGYMNTLSAGVHPVNVEFLTGTVETAITVRTAEAPKTGDNSMMTLWVVLALASLTGMAVTVLYSRKVRQ